MAERLCTIDGCTKNHLARGYCSMHYRRWREHGDPAVVLTDRHTKVCTVDGCDRPIEGKGLCFMHYARFKTHGEAGPAARLREPNGEGSIDDKGYRVLFRPGHVLARAQGKLYEHRLVHWEASGSDPRPCHWCSVTVYWVAEADQALLVVDHLDDNGLNNTPENLVSSCIPCNAERGRNG